MDTVTLSPSAPPPAGPDPTTPHASQTHPLPRRGYGGLWRRVPRELGFLLLTLPIAMIGLSVLASLFWTGVGTIVIVIGIAFLVAALYVARAFGTVEMVRLRWAGQPSIRPPRWEEPGRALSFWQAVFGPFTNGHYWLHLLHGMIVNPIISIITWTLTVVWTAVTLNGFTYWIWGRFVSEGDGDRVWLSDVVADFVFPGNTLSVDPLLAESLFMLALGIVFLVTLPLITRGMTLLHQGIARGMLGAWRSDALQREVADLSASRGAAVAAEDRTLRQLERDIHDGPQQRLVRLQMDLAAAERKLDTDPAAARGILSEARGQAKETLDELRALSQGFAPPILQDRGLIAGLESLAARSTVPVTCELDVANTVVIPPEVERSAYFVAAELLANVAKHSGATAARLNVSTRREVDTDWLDLWVIDDGIGGAQASDGHGLHGLTERLSGLRGVLTVDSPAGGPTSIGAHIPLAGAASGVVIQ